MEFKDRLKELRKERGLSQQDLADEIFVSRSAVAKWENGLGYPDKANLETLCERFGTEVLLPDEDKKLILARKRGRKAALAGIIVPIVCLLISLFPLFEYRVWITSYVPPHGVLIQLGLWALLPLAFWAAAAAYSVFWFKKPSGSKGALRIGICLMLLSAAVFVFACVFAVVFTDNMFRLFFLP